MLIGFFSGGKKTRTCTVPSVFSVAMVRLIGVRLGGQVGMPPDVLGGPSLLRRGYRAVRAGGGLATASCISWAHGEFVRGSEGFESGLGTVSKQVDKWEEDESKHTALDLGTRPRDRPGPDPGLLHLLETAGSRSQRDRHVGDRA